MINRFAPFYSAFLASAAAARSYGLQLKCLVLILAVLAFRGRRRRAARATWLIGENFGECLQDNGYCFFRYCRDSGAAPFAWFVARRESVRSDRYLAGSGNVVVYGSLRHITTLLDADVLLCSHTHRDLMFHRLFPLLARGKRMVFLRHGVTGFKKFNAYYHEYRNEADLLVAVSDREKRLMSERVGIDADRIRVTGFARHDCLHNSAAPMGTRQIAYMPTFRDWLQPSQLPGSGFFREVSALLADPSLAALLEDNDVVLRFYLHKNMRACLPFFRNTGPRVRIVQFGEESVQQMLRESHLLITDYSSVSWDFHYMGKPVVFYQFDLDEYLEKRGAYLDMRRDLFGDRAERPGDLLSLLRWYVDNGFREKDAYREQRQRMFSFSDSRNCERIFREVAALDGTAAGRGAPAGAAA